MTGASFRSIIAPKWTPVYRRSRHVRTFGGLRLCPENRTVWGIARISICTDIRGKPWKTLTTRLPFSDQWCIA